MKKPFLQRTALALGGSAILAFGLCHIHAHAEVTEVAARVHDKFQRLLDIVLTVI